MGLVADLAAHLVSVGVTGNDLVTALRIAEDGKVREVNRSANAERQARFRAKNKGVTRNGDSNANGDQKSYEESNLDPKKSPTKKAPKGATKGKVLRSRKTEIAEDAQPVDRDFAAAERVNMTIEVMRIEWPKFRSHHRARGSLMKDWSQAWVTWVCGWAGGYGRNSTGPPAPRKENYHDMMREDLEILARARGASDDDDEGNKLPFSH